MRELSHLGLTRLLVAVKWSAMRHRCNSLREAAVGLAGDEHPLNLARLGRVRRRQTLAGLHKWLKGGGLV